MDKIIKHSRFGENYAFGGEKPFYTRFAEEIPENN